MKGNARIVGAILIGAGSWFLASQMNKALRQHAALTAKRIAKTALHSWENEGGALIEPAVPAAVS